MIPPLLSGIAGVLAIGLIAIVLRIYRASQLHSDQLAMLLGMRMKGPKLEQELKAYAARLTDLIVQSQEQLEVVNQHLVRMSKAQSAQSAQRNWDAIDRDTYGTYRPYRKAD
jgi:hypothetical protein